MVAGDEPRRRPRRPARRSAGARSRSSRLPVAWLRMCSSSPMFSPWAARPNTSTGPALLEQPRRAAARARRGRSAGRSTASSSPTPNHSVRPGPRSASRTRAAPPSSTTHTGIDGEQTPVIGPTWSCSLPGSSAISPRCEQRRRLGAIGRPALEHAAASSARRCGSHTRSHAIGGPECSSSPSRSPGTTVPAGATVTARGDAPSIAATASRVGRRDRVAVAAPQPRQQRHRRRRRRPAGASRPRRPTAPCVAQRVGERRRARR